MVDIHAHVLPAIDDGAEDLNEAVQMLRVAVNNGTTDLVLTPHFLADSLRCEQGIEIDEIKKRFSAFCEEAKEYVPEINLYLGAEVFAVNNIEDYIDEKKLLTINDSKYILLEFDFDDRPQRALEITQVLMEAGYRVVIAHPERYSFVQYNPRLIVPFLNEGALLQVNASSLLGRSGAVAQDVAFSFIENRMAVAVASDAHSAYYRSPDLSEAYSVVSSNFSLEYSDLLFTQNPLNIIKGKRI